MDNFKNKSLRIQTNTNLVSILRQEKNKILEEDVEEESKKNSSNS